MSDTIIHRYDPTVNLPQWAQGDPNIVAYAARSLEFRCKVWDADTAQMKKLLRNEARQWANR